MRSLPVLSLLAVFVLLIAAVASDSMPTTPDELFQYARKHHNYRDWRKAERAYQLFLDKFGKHEKADDAMWWMARLQGGPARRHEAARTWWGRYLKTYPKSKRYWSARLQYAATYSRQNLRTRALEEFRKIRAETSVPNVEQSAIQNILNLKNEYLRPYVNQSFTAGERPMIRVNSRNIASAKMRVYQLDADALGALMLAKKISIQDAAARIGKKHRKLLEERVLPLAVAKWFNGKVHLDVTDAGVYSVEVEHVEEKYSVAVTVLVSRYGLITKTDGEKLLVYAQDRRDGAPVANMTIRAFSGDRVVEDKTGKDGLFVARNMKNSTVIGVHDGEYVFAQGNASWIPRRQSRYYIFTDRPIYRPGHTVRIKVVHRIEAEGELEVQDNLRLKVKVYDARNNPVTEFEGRINEYGSLSGSFVLGAEPALGNYRIQVEALDKTEKIHGWYGAELNSRGRFRVDEYRKPEYKVDVAFEQPRYIQGEVLKGEIAANYYFGSPVPKAKVTWELYKRSKWASFWRRVPSWYSWYGDSGGKRRRGGYHGGLVARGEGATDVDGKFAFSYPTPVDEHDAAYTLVAKVTDLSRRQEQGAASVSAHRATFGLGVSTKRGVIEAGEGVRGSRARQGPRRRARRRLAGRAACDAPFVGAQGVRRDRHPEADRPHRAGRNRPHSIHSRPRGLASCSSRRRATAPAASPTRSATSGWSPSVGTADACVGTASTSCPTARPTASATSCASSSRPR